MPHKFRGERDSVSFCSVLLRFVVLCCALLCFVVLSCLAFLVIGAIGLSGCCLWLCWLEERCVCG